ncbi:5-dehydro-4-deoxyglucarate dehydratase [Herbiconiux sp. VKM Ac-2851]|uniref:5-dehydro-4-deoxyglucarate dehydratase n=1 Tax=Herbiconiux sp. VKM Ac-2851 TaxID=2739025 RepID=UPI00156331C7|nr:5-dehydro-4-deoxyglucarate dehydratase [Herbiconiux sp. VKM Ac-2851]NQX36969.1 5-dehydro-4-deoxyglucarate dehydratase [Herbiconiux sp. VKM Ac-2851]
MSDADAPTTADTGAGTTPAAPAPALAFDGVLFFPVTPFGPDGGIDHGMLAEHVASRLPFGPGAVFPACGTGEFHALGAREVEDVVRTTVAAVAGRVPVLSGAGGPLGHAIDNARSAEAAGADGLLLLPPYLVSGTTEGLVAYVEAVLAATSLPVVLYHRGTARYTPDAVRRLAAHPQVIGFKDGTGDIGATQEIVLAARATGRELQFFNGLLTAELTQGAFRGIGVPLYSSAAFAMIPELAALHYAAYTAGDEETRLRLLEEFYVPLVRLRDETPGFGVSLIKAGLRLRGLAVGSVRPPLVDPTAEQEARLAALLDAGLALAAELAPAGGATTAAAAPVATASADTPR